LTGVGFISGVFYLGLLAPRVCLGSTLTTTASGFLAADLLTDYGFFSIIGITLVFAMAAITCRAFVGLGFLGDPASCKALIGLECFTIGVVYFGFRVEVRFSERPLSSSIITTSFTSDFLMDLTASFLTDCLAEVLRGDVLLSSC